jgi:preprotein translocase subunit SecG
VYTVLVILHVLVAFVMIGVILLQSGKGAEIGAAFGGSSQTVFGSRGAGTLLSKVTAVTATVFFFTSMTLAVMSKQRTYSSTIGLDKPSGVPAATTPPPGVPTPTQPMTDQPGTQDGNAPAPATPSPAPTKP